MYRVEYMGKTLAWFPTRDLALDYFLKEMGENPLRDAGDYEILDGSDD